MAEGVELLVDNRRYGGWKAVRVTRSIESLSGSFEIEATDRWAGQDEAWPILEEDSCRILINGDPVIKGYVDSVSVSLSADSRAVSYAGRDRAAALVDCAAKLTEFSFRGAGLLEVIRKIAAPFGIPVALAPGVVLAKPQRKIACSPDGNAFDVIARLAQPAGVMVVSDGAGGILLTRAGASRAAPLVQGENILSASVSHSASERFYRYVVLAQAAGTDSAHGKATQIRAEAIDEGVSRRDRELVIRAADGLSTEQARARADWEARIRAAKAQTVDISVVGWTQPNGKLWPVNAISEVRSPAIGLDGGMLISQAEYSASDAGRVTRLTLVRPDAFTPEPDATVAELKAVKRARRPAGFRPIRNTGATLPDGGA